MISRLDFPLYSTQWLAREELLLFEGMEKFGFGNWDKIVKHLGTGKSKAECRDHYKKTYLENKNRLPSKPIIERDPTTLELIIEQPEENSIDFEQSIPAS